MDLFFLLETAERYVWGPGTVALVLLCGALLTVRTRAIQVRGLPAALKETLRGRSGAEGITSFRALCTALAATVGTGNVVGVASAVTLGGPGALLWMQLAAFLGMATRYAEAALAVRYRRAGEDGGPFRYIELGLRECFPGRSFRWLGRLFAACGALAGAFGVGTAVQSASASAAAERLFPSGVLGTLGGRPVTCTAAAAALILTALSLPVLAGGSRRIARASGVLVPVMGVGYVFFSLWILLRAAPQLPAAIGLILRSAFDPSAVSGALCGLSLKTTVRIGVERGVFSNEAGLGSGPIADGAVQNADPVRQGRAAMLGPLIDTGIVCTLTGLCTVVTGAWAGGGEGFDVAAAAWERGLPFAAGRGGALLAVLLAVFAYTTVLGWHFYAEKCFCYITGGRGLLPFRFLCLLGVLLGPLIPPAAAWSLAGVLCGLMAIPNLCALLFLSGKAANEKPAPR